MKPLMKIKSTVPSVLIVLTLCSPVFVPKMARAVPPPDGCFPGFTTAEGCNALKFLTTGAANTGLGWYSLWVNTTGNHNTASGYHALFNNTSSSDNSAFGWGALTSNAFGQINTATGYLALH